MPGLFPPGRAVVTPVRKGTGIKCEGKRRARLGSVRERPSQLSMTGASGRQVQPEFPSGHILWACLGGQRDRRLCLGWKSLLRRRPPGWGGFGCKSHTKTANSRNMSEIFSTCHRGLVVHVPSCLLCPFAALPAAPGYGLVPCSGGSITLGPGGDKPTTIRWLQASIYR